MNLVFFVEEFAKAVQSETVKNEHEGVLSVHIGEFEVFFAHFENRNAIMLHASLDTHDGSNEALMRLLKMNNFFEKTYGVCLGIDGEVITAQQNIYISEHDSNLELELFMEQCHLFLTASALIMEELKQDITKNNAQNDETGSILLPNNLI